MLRIKRSVQSAFNTEASYIAAQAAAARLGAAANNKMDEDAAVADQADPMAALEGGSTTKGPSFVAAKSQGFKSTTAPAVTEEETAAAQANPDESQL